MKEAPLNLVFVADHARMGRMDDDGRKFHSATNAGFISHNVYLYCESEGLAAVVRGSVERNALVTTLKLRPEQKIILAQTIGYPEEQ